MDGTTALPLASPLPSSSPPASDPAPLASPRAHEVRSLPPTARRSLSARALLGALLGFVGLGTAAALGVPAGAGALRLIPSVLLVELAALALTAPALIVTHQFLRLAADPEALAAALGRALIHGGRVAAGLAIVVFFYAATTDVSLLFMIASLALVGVFTSVTACVELSHAERTASGDGVAELPLGFPLLVCGWLVLSWAIALRVGASVTTWVVGL